MACGCELAYETELGMGAERVLGSFKTGSGHRSFFLEIEREVSYIFHGDIGESAFAGLNF